MRVVLVALAAAAFLLAGCGSPDDAVQETPAAAGCDPNPGTQPSKAERYLQRFFDDPETQAKRLRAIVEQVAADAPWTLADTGQGEFWSGPHRYLVDAWNMPPEGPFFVRYYGPTAWTSEEAARVAAAFRDAWDVAGKDLPPITVATDDRKVHALARQPAPYGSGSLELESWTGDDRPQGYATSMTAWPLFDVSLAPWPVDAAEAGRTAALVLGCLAGADAAQFEATRPAPQGPTEVRDRSAAYEFKFMQGRGEPSCMVATVVVDAVTGAVLQADLGESAFCDMRADPEP